MPAIHEALSDCLNAGFIDHHASHCIICNPAAGPQSPDHDGYDNHDDFGLAHQVVQPTDLYINVLAPQRTTSEGS